MNTKSGNNEQRTPEEKYFSRRKFIGQSAVYGSAFWALWNFPRPLTLAAAAASSEPVILSEHQWRTVVAVTGRIIPTDHESGAIEANCVNFIDKALANEDKGQKLTYEAGLAGLDAVAHERFNVDFTALTASQQDEILVAVESGNPQGWPTESGSPVEFFETVRTHTIIGSLADPKYGGNRDYVGWKVIGYPGPRHYVGGYTPKQMLGEQKIKAIWGDEI